MLSLVKFQILPPMHAAKFQKHCWGIVKSLALTLMLLVGARSKVEAAPESSGQDHWVSSGFSLNIPAERVGIHRRCITANQNGVYVGVFGVGVPGGDNVTGVEQYGLDGSFVQLWSESFSGIAGLASDLAGNVYVFDRAAGLVKVFSSSGSLFRSFGNTGQVGTVLSNANGAGISQGIAVANSGLVYVADGGNQCVKVFDSNGNFLRNIGEQSSPHPAGDSGTGGIAVDAAGNLFTYVRADGYGDNHSVRKFAPDGTWLLDGRTYGSSNCGGFTLTATRDGVVIGGYYWYSWDGRVGILGPDASPDNTLENTVVFAADVIPQSYAEGCSADPFGNIWLVRNNTVLRSERRMRFDAYIPAKIVPQPSILNVSQSPGSQNVNIDYQVVAAGSYDSALIGFLNGVRSWDNLVIAGSQNVVKTVLEGSVGSGTATAGGSTNTAPLGTVTLFAGSPSPSFPGAPPIAIADGVGAAAIFNSVNSLTRDSAGNLYLDDFSSINSGTSRVVAANYLRKVTPTGNVSTLTDGSFVSGTDSFGNAIPLPMALSSDRLIVGPNQASGLFTLSLTGSLLSSVNVLGDAEISGGPGLMRTAVDSFGNLYVLSGEPGFSAQKILRISGGTITTIYMGQATATWDSSSIFNITATPAGDVYAFTSTAAKRLVDGSLLLIAGTESAMPGPGEVLDGVGSAARLSFPTAMASDAAGNILFINQYYNPTTGEYANSLRVLTPAGIVKTIPSLSSSLPPNTFVQNIVPGDNGVIYLSASNAIYKYSPAVTPSLITAASWNLAADLPNTPYANMAFEVLARDDRALVGVHFVTIPSDNANPQPLTVSNRPVLEADLFDFWLWLLAKNDPRVTRQGNAVVMTPEGQALATNIPSPYGGNYGATNVLHDGSSTTVIGFAFACKVLGYRPITPQETDRVNSGQFVSSIGYNSVVLSAGTVAGQ